MKRYTDHICTICHKKTNYAPGRYPCNNCAYKKDYFGGLYWDVMKRDDNKCVECGRGDISLNIHHKNHNNKDNRMDNLEVLCVNCHSKKRVFICIECEKKTIASSANQSRCAECGKKHERIMSYIRQSRYWRKRNSTRYDWYLTNIRELTHTCNTSYKLQ